MQNCKAFNFKHFIYFFIFINDYPTMYNINIFLKLLIAINLSFTKIWRIISDYLYNKVIYSSKIK